MKKPSQNVSTLSRSTGVRIRFKDRNGEIKSLTEAAFYKMFGVKYLRRLQTPKPLPKAFVRQCRYFDALSQDHKKSDAIRLSHFHTLRNFMSPTYVAKVDDVVGFGLFAYEDIKPGEYIGEYVGILSQNWKPLDGPSADFNPYLMRFPFNCTFAIDPLKCGNELRFMNHSEAHPNAQKQFVMWECLLHAVFIATKPILKNHQILFDYGKSYWRHTSPAFLAP